MNKYFKRTVFGIAAAIFSTSSFSAMVYTTQESWSGYDIQIFEPDSFFEGNADYAAGFSLFNASLDSGLFTSATMFGEVSTSQNTIFDPLQISSSISSSANIQFSSTNTTNGFITGDSQIIVEFDLATDHAFDFSSTTSSTSSWPSVVGYQVDLLQSGGPALINAALNPNGSNNFTGILAAGHYSFSAWGGSGILLADPIDPFIGYNHLNGENTFSSVDLSFTLSLTEISAVPVPSAVWLFGSGLIGLIGVARRKKNTQ